MGLLSSCEIFAYKCKSYKYSVIDKDVIFMLVDALVSGLT